VLAFGSLRVSSSPGWHLQNHHLRPQSFRLRFQDYRTVMNVDWRIQTDCIHPCYGAVSQYVVVRCQIWQALGPWVAKEAQRTYFDSVSVLARHHLRRIRSLNDVRSVPAMKVA
jgi:hypothetical protein